MAAEASPTARAGIARHAPTTTALARRLAATYRHAVVAVLHRPEQTLTAVALLRLGTGTEMRREEVEIPTELDQDRHYLHDATSCLAMLCHARRCL